MKILIVSPHLPLPTWGAGARTYHLMKALLRAHDVTMVAPKPLPDEPPPDPLDPELAPRLTLFDRAGQPSKRWRQLASVVRGRSYLVAEYERAELQRAVDAAFARERYDLVLFESIFVAGMRVPPGVRVAIDQHNVEHEMLARTAAQASSPLRKWYNRMEARLLEPIEAERCRRADLVLTTSERERALLQPLAPTTVFAVVPNGVDVGHVTPDAAARPVPGRVVFTGAMSHHPNAHAAVFFAERCWPRIREHVPEATWQIVGSAPPAAVRGLAGLPGVEVTGWVPDTRPYMQEAEVALAPLLMGSGTRLKILEAFAMERPVVSTSLGCEGLAVVPGVHLLVADEPEAIADAVVALLRDPGRRAALAAAARRLVEERYSWERCGATLLDALDRLRGEVVAR